MFAPYCASCRSQVLLSTRRLVSIGWDGTAPLTATLRCYCGRIVDWNAAKPVQRPALEQLAQKYDQRGGSSHAQDGRAGPSGVQDADQSFGEQESEQDARVERQALKQLL